MRKFEKFTDEELRDMLVLFRHARENPIRVKLAIEVVSEELYRQLTPGEIEGLQRINANPKPPTPELVKAFRERKGLADNEI